MIFEKFELHADPHIHNARCKCGTTLEEVSNGWFDMALFCPKCENVYVLTLVKLPASKVSPEFLAQAKKEIDDEAKCREIKRRKA